MRALKEFANVIIQNNATLAEVYAQLLAESDEQYAKISRINRVTTGRKLLNAVVEAFETNLSEPLQHLFTERNNGDSRCWPANVDAPDPALELECLERTLTPVVSNLEAGKFLWQVLAEVRSAISGSNLRTLSLETHTMVQGPIDETPLAPDLERKVAQDERPQNNEQYHISAEPAFETSLIAQPEAVVDINNRTSPVYKDESFKVSGKDAEESSASTSSDEVSQSSLADYDKELRKDSFYNIIFATGILVVLAGGLQLFFFSSGSMLLLQFGIYIIAPLFVNRWSWKLVQQGKQTLGTWLFIWAHLLLITFAFSQAETPGTALPYLYGYFIVVSSTLIEPAASFNVWLASIALLFGASIYRGQLLDGVLETFTPIVINLFLAIGSFLTALDWRDAIQSTTILHLRAQRRRDELFAVQTELKRANVRQRSLHNQLITSVEVGQRIATLIDLDDLLSQVVDLIRTQLNFAYVGTFLLEDDTFLAVQAQSGDKLTTDAQQPRISINQENILGLTAAQRQYVINPDVRTMKFTQHPYLSPNSLSEIGLPLIVGDCLYGVLNIQNYGVKAFDEDNLPIVRLLANQVAIALHNAQLFNDAIVARREAEQANEIKSRFLASMSHELRTPLNAILNFTGFVVDGIFGPINPEQVDALEKTLDSGTHLLSIINDILDLAKVEAGTMGMFIEDIDMKGLLKSAAATGKGLLKNKPVELILDIDQDLPDLAGDKRRLRQTLLNLVSNAAKYTRAGSITIAARQDHETIQISIQDTGIGIALEDQTLIFESFHRAHNALTSELGTGLGLSIAKHFVEAHGGQIWLESKVGVGTTFYVRLPLKLVGDQYTVSSAQRN